MLCVLLLIVAVALCVPGDVFRITSLPGVAKMPSFGLYSGYITVDASAGRALFFYFAEAKRNSKTAPLVLWLTGGPGCSSALAFLGENGPFQVQKDLHLESDRYSWNDEANMIWLESPAGVGFSYSNTTSDYSVGDARTAADTYTFLQQFIFYYFPQFAKNPFWVTGESYGGHYVPEITALIFQNNALGHARINVQGLMVGNAWTYAPIDNAGALNYWWTHALIPQADVDAAFKACNLSDIGPLTKGQIHSRDFAKGWQGFGAGCNQIVGDIQAAAFNDVDIYDIYIDVCHANLQQSAAARFANAGSVVHRAMALHKKRSVLNPNPCIEGFIHDYLNLPNVQKAIHAIPTQWHMCSPVVQYSYQDILSSVIPTYDYLISQAAKILVYSGDVDAIVPYLGTAAWVTGMQLPIKEKWRAWHHNDSFGAQTGGFVVEYDGLTFATVRNAGHEVPFYQSVRGGAMFRSFLFTQKLPK